MAEPAKPPASTPRPELPTSVLEAAARGDGSAGKRFVEHYQDLVYGYVSRFFASRQSNQTVDDVVQDTFLRALGALRRFDPDGSAKLSTWLLTIATRRAIDVLRRSRNHVALDAVPLVADERVERRVLTRSVYRAIASLSAEQRAAFLLRELYGMTASETAAALRIEPGTVKSRVARARAKLRSALGGRR